MAFSVDDFQDLLRLLDVHPEWREELRARLLTQELLELPALVRELAQGMRELQSEMSQLVAQVRDMNTRVADHSGRLLEMDYRTKGPAFFGPIARRLRLVDFGDLAVRLDDARARGQISEDELDAVMATDAVLEGRRRSDGEEVYLLVEVSWGIGMSDVQRAKQRSNVLAKLGKTVIPVVAGKWMDGGLDPMADTLGVWRVFDGMVQAPQSGS